jgi:hypothetical protein
MYVYRQFQAKSTVGTFAETANATDYLLSFVDQGKQTCVSRFPYTVYVYIETAAYIYRYSVYIYMCVYIDMFIYIFKIQYIHMLPFQSENGSYPFANGLNGLNGLDHRCTGESSFFKYRSEFPVCQREHPIATYSTTCRHTEVHSAGMGRCMKSKDGITLRKTRYKYSTGGSNLRQYI